MKNTLFIAKVGRLNASGYFVGYDIIGYCVTRELAEKVAEAYRAKHQVGQYWIWADTDRDNNIRVTIEEVNIPLVTEKNIEEVVDNL